MGFQAFACRKLLHDLETPFGAYSSDPSCADLKVSSVRSASHFAPDSFARAGGASHAVAPFAEVATDGDCEAVGASLALRCKTIRSPPSALPLCAGGCGHGIVGGLPQAKAAGEAEAQPSRTWP